MIYTTLYLSAIVFANLLVTKFGSGSVIPVSFFFIGLDLTARDKLHNAWHNNGLLWKMGLLILSGSVLSWLINKDAGTIAIASFVAFSCAAIVDTIVYHSLFKKPFFVKVNVSNVFSALVDSIVFPTVAFGGFLPMITLGQFLAKVLGGFVWGLILKKGK